jgi:hypothetical protein
MRRRFPGAIEPVCKPTVGFSVRTERSAAESKCARGPRLRTLAGLGTYTQTEREAGECLGFVGLRGLKPI